MSNFNLVVLMGRLVRDPEMRYTPKGTAICKIGLAVNRTWKSESGEKMEEPMFCDCDAFGKTAEVIAQYLKKGSSIHLSGRLKMDSWTDKTTNQQRTKLGVVIESFQFMDSGKQDGGESRQRTAPTASAAPSVQAELDTDQTVPF